MSDLVKVFRWGRSRKHADYGGSSSADDRRMRWSMGEPLGEALPSPSDWTSARLRQYLGEGPKLRKPAPIGDSPGSAVVNLISPLAAKSLHDVWQRDALLYPVILEDDPAEPYYMVVARTQLGWDSLDEDRSEFGISQSDGKVYAVKKWVFFADKIGEHDLFVLPNSPTAYFVTRRFVDLVLAANLKGFRFDSVYLDPKPLTT